MAEYADPQSKLSSVLEERRAWEALTSSPPWLKLIQVLQEQADELQRGIIYTPLSRQDDVYLQEFRKGQLEGRLSITVTAETILSELDFDINQLKEQLDDSRSTTNSGFRNAP